MPFEFQKLLQELEANLPVMLYQFVLHPDGSYSMPFVSKGAYEMFELSAEQIQQDVSCILNLVDPENIESFFKTILHSADTLTAWSTLFRVKVPSGKRKWVKGHSKPQRHQNGQVIWNGILFDVTEQKEAEETLARSENLLNATSKIADIGGWEVDLQTLTPIWTEQTYAIYGVAPHTPLTIELQYSFYPGQERRQLQACLETLIATGRSFDIELPIITAQGQRRWVRKLGQTTFEDGKLIRIFGAIQDITVQKEAAETLARSQNLLQITGKLTQVGGWEVNLKTGQPIWSEELYRIHEVPPGTPINQEYARTFFDEPTWDYIQQHLKNLVNTGLGFDLEALLTTAAGRQKWVRILGNSIIQHGRVVKIYGAYQDITTQKEADQLYKSSREQFKIAFDNAAVGMGLMHPNGHWLKLNKSMCQIFGYTEEELLQGSFKDITYPDDIAANVAYLQEIAENKRDTFRMEKRYYHKQGHIVWGILNVSCVRDEKGKVQFLISQVIDITAQKRAELLHTQSEERFKSSFDNAAIGMALVSTQGHWLKVNKSLCQTLGYSAEELQQMTFQEITHPDDLETDIILGQQMLDNQLDHCQTEKRYYHKQGHLVWTLQSVSCVRKEDGTAAYFISQVDDITEKKKIELDLIAAKEQAEQAVVAKSQFLSTMSHEIRTPLNAVIGITHLLLKNNKQPEQLKNLNVLKYSAENLLVLINDILDFSKIEEGKIRFEKIPFNLFELIHNIQAALLPSADEKGLTLELRLDEAMPQTVTGDPVRISQIFTNLINNAIKFTQKGGITIHAIVQEQAAAYALIHFRITDTGIGIPDDKIDYIFDLFTQASSDTTRKYGGTGLGLAITKKLLQLQNSTIRVESIPGVGSSFMFDLKLPISAAENEPVATVPADKVPLKGVKLLLAEDNAFNVFVAEQFLHDWQIAFDVAATGKEALVLLEKQSYDLILMDLQMPEMDGYQATEIIRSAGVTEWQHLPIIALTASAISDIKDRGFAVGITDYISKPFKPDELYQKIHQYSCLQTN